LQPPSSIKHAFVRHMSWLGANGETPIKVHLLLSRFEVFVLVYILLECLSNYTAPHILHALVRFKRWTLSTVSRCDNHTIIHVRDFGRPGSTFARPRLASTLPLLRSTEPGCRVCSSGVVTREVLFERASSVVRMSGVDFVIQLEHFRSAQAYIQLAPERYLCTLFGGQFGAVLPQYDCLVEVCHYL
jgi:hypothetical protein